MVEVLKNVVLARKIEAEKMKATSKRIGQDKMNILAVIEENTDN